MVEAHIGSSHFHIKQHHGPCLVCLRSCHNSGDLVADFSPRSLGFAPRVVHVGFVVEKVELGQFFFPNSSVFHCQYNSIATPYPFMYRVGGGEWVC
jgi:hypothetical protein